MATEHYMEDCIICPYCDHKFTDSWEWSECRDAECGECGKEFDLEVQTDVSYTTRPTEQESES